MRLSMDIYSSLYFNAILVPVDTCDRLDPVSHGSYNNDSCTDSDSIYESVCTLSCEYGYIREGPEVRQCEVGGEWNTTQTSACNSMIYIITEFFYMAFRVS